MPESGSAQSPLVQFWKQPRSSRSAAGGVRLTERMFMGQLNIRGDARNFAFVAAVRRATGLSIPTAPNTSSISGDLAMLWLGPDEWLILSPRGSELGVAESLRQALAPVWHAVTDISSGYTLIELTGPRVSDMLAKGCSLDLDARVFRVGDCAQAHVAKAIALLWRLETERFALIVRRSFAEYLAMWIEDAAAEFGFCARAEDATALVALNPEVLAVVEQD